MANTLAGLTLAQISDKSLASIAPVLLPLKAFTTDFSEDIADKGSSVTTRYTGLLTAQDVSGGYVATDVTTTSKTIQLNQQMGFVMAFTDYEASTMNFATLTRLFITPAKNAICTKVMTDILALVVNATFAANSVVALNALDSDAMDDLAMALTVAKVPASMRFALLSPGYYNSLAKDGSIKNALNSGSTAALRERMVGRISGFDTYEYTEIPNNGENLAGIVGTSDALIIAARQKALPTDTDMEVENVIDPDTGLPLQYRRWYEKKEGKNYLTVESLYGVKDGNPAFLRRMVTA